MSSETITTTPELNIEEMLEQRKLKNALRLGQLAAVDGIEFDF